MKSNKLFIILTFFVFMPALANAASVSDYFIALSDYTVNDKTYEATFSSDLKCKNYIVYAEVPSEQAAGSVAWRCGSSNTGRFLYFVVNGTQDSSRKIEMKNGYSSDFSFTPADITEKDGKYYLVFSTADDYKAKSMKYTLTAGDVETVSNDATLKSLVYGSAQTPVPDFSPDITQYDVELPAGTTIVPSVSAEPNDDNAQFFITQAAALPGTASVIVTAEDGVTTKKYIVNFTVESANPKVLSATWENIRGTATIDNVSMTITGQVTNGSSLTLTPKFEGKYIASWTPDRATDFSNSANEPVKFLFSAGTGEMSTYHMTVTEAPAMSSDATLKSLSVTGYSISFSPETFSYNVELKEGTTSAPEVKYEVNDPKAVADVTKATGVPGATKITVTAEDGTSLTYTVNFTVKVPQSGLSIHMPEVYEAKEIAGGYSGTLSVVNGREYEVYYASFTEEGELSVTVTPVQKSNGITTPLSDYNCKAKDGWLEMKTTTSKSNYTMSENEEYKAGSSAVHKLLNNAYYKMHVQGFDQFSFIGKDNNADESKGKHFEVYIDGVKQSMTLANSATIRRFDMTTGEHLIEVRGVGASNNEFYGFSLRVAQEPRTKRIKGDSAQTVLQTTAVKPVYYFTKYASKGETKLVWDDGKDDKGIKLSLHASDKSDLGDTLVLNGVADFATGVYPFNVISYFNGTETSRVPGAIIVSSELKALTDTIVDAYQGEEMESVEFRYYALDASNIKLEWKDGNAPAGITGSAKSNNRFVIGGATSATPGIYRYTITVEGGNSITGYIEVISQDLGVNPVLYLYKTKKPQKGYNNDGVYSFLRSRGVNLQPRTTISGMRAADQYAKFNWILISADVDADNEEVLAIMKQSPKPVLNMKAFTYAPGRVTEEGWGEPNNGSADSTTNNGCNIYVQRPDHPVFKDFNKKVGEKITVFAKTDAKGVMPIAVNLPGTMCLATAYTQSIEEYYKDGEQQTIIHEIPAEMRGGVKYICLPLALNQQDNLTSDGKKLLESIVNYLTDGKDSGIELPMLQINNFSVEGINADISQAQNTITLNMTTKKYSELDSLRSVKPVISLADEVYSHVTLGSGKEMENEMNLMYTTFMSQAFVVTDYINRRVYNLSTRLSSTEGIEEVYEAGQWVNIFDIYGRKVATTNEDIYSMDLPHGMYIVLTENGQTIKLMR